MGVGFELSDAHVEQVSENDCGCDSLCMHTFVQKKMHYKRSQPEKKKRIWFYLSFVHSSTTVGFVFLADL